MASKGNGPPWQRRELDNLTELAELTEENLLESIKKRYEEGVVYTDVGDILVSINPFRELPIYSDECSAVYSTPDLAVLAPHIFRSAARAFSALLDCRRDQVFVISGESGAGKTESAKLLMRQFMTMCRSSNVGQHIQEKIVQTNPLLEAFGNATTVLNNNSSRFGKFLQLVFTEDGRIMGAGLEEYLVEKSRVSCQAIDERNFHIFYYLFAGLSEKERKRLNLKSPLDHQYLKAYPRVVEDCSSKESRSQFQLVVKSLQCIGFLDSEYQDLLTLLATILHIGDIEFYGSEGCEESAGVLNPEVVEFVSLSTGLDSPLDLVFVLTTLRTVTRGETIDKPYSCAKAADVRDAIAKTLYQRMFRWIIHHINVVLEPPEKEGYLHMGILDIFGFEIFVHNNFEQFCINLANEQLQQYFNHHIFAMEKDEYAKEGVDGLDIHFRDNKPVLDLFLMRPIGLLSLLEEQSRSPKGSDAGFVQKCRDAFRKNENFVPHRGDFPIFSVKHYAAEVEYEADTFLEKNNDSLPSAVVSLFQTSSNQLISTFFNRPEAIDATLRHKPVLKRSQASIVRKMSTLRRSTIHRRRSRGGASVQQRGQESRKGGAGGGRKGQTVTTYFRESLQLLMERLCVASPHFIRCIKPNQKQKPFTFDSDFVVKQLRYTGMVEAVRVRRQGYSFRPFFSDFVQEFRGIAYKCTEEVHPSEASCKHILETAGIEGWKLGKARVFLRYFHEEQLHAMLRDMQYKAALIQKVFRGHAIRRRTRPLLKQARESQQKTQSFLLSISAQGTGLQDRLIRLNNTDVKLRDKRFPRQQPKPAEGSPRTVYTGLEYHDYGAGSHHWPGEEGPGEEGAGEGGVAPKPWMVPAIPLPSGPKVEGWRRSTTPKGESKFQSGLGSVNSFSTEALDEIDESPILPRAQLKRSDSIDDDTLQKRKSGILPSEQGLSKRRETSKIQQLKMKLLGDQQKTNRRVKSETDSGPPPSAPPPSADTVSTSDEFFQLSHDSVADKSVMPVCFHRSLSVEGAKILMSERDPGSYIAVPSTFRSLYGEEYILIVSGKNKCKMYPVMRSRDSTLYLQTAGETSKDETRAVKFFTLEHLMKYYVRQALPDGSELKEPVILGGVQVLHYSRKQDKGSPKNGGTARPSSWKQGLKLPWKKRNPPPPKRQDWEI